MAIAAYGSRFPKRTGLVQRAVGAIRKLSLENHEVVIELLCSGSGASIEERRGLEFARRQLAIILRSLNTHDVVSARVASDRFVIAIRGSLASDPAKTLAMIQEDLVSKLRCSRTDVVLALETSSMTRSECRASSHELECQRSLDFGSTSLN